MGSHHVPKRGRTPPPKCMHQPKDHSTMSRPDTPRDRRIRRRRASSMSGNLLAAFAICLSFAGHQNHHAVYALSIGGRNANSNNSVRSKLLPAGRRIQTSRSSNRPTDAHLLVAAAHHLGRYPWGASSRKQSAGTTSTCRSLFSSPSTRPASSALAATEPDAETQLAQLRQENEILRLQVAELEEENLRLHKHGGPMSPENIIIERFEGERKPLLDENGEEILPWYERDGDDEDDADREVLPGQKALMAFGDNSTEIVVLPAKKKSSEPPMSDLTADLAGVGSASSSSTSLSTEDECGDNEYDAFTCPIEPDVSFGDALRDRAYWLCGLLAMQSLSGFILARNEVLLQNHPVIIYFLTMLVGAGGNAGNQASVRVIRGLALGTLNESTQRQFLNREFKMALCLCGLLSTAGFIRAAAFRTPLPETVAITASLALIVFSSIGLGAVLPLVLQKLRVDPAHSSTTIQVIMDILGVVMTVFVSTLMLDSPVGQYIISKLT